jgi:hypothetical protein
MIRDTDSTSYVFTDADVNRTIIDKGIELSAQVGQAQLWVTGALTMTAGDASDVQLPSSAGENYEQVLQLRFQTSGNLCRKLDLDTIEDLRRGTSAGAGEPSYFGLYEDPTTKLFVRWGTIPGVTRSVDVFRAILPTAGYTDGTTIPVSNLMLDAIRKAAAAELVAKCAADKLMVLALSPGAAASWSFDVSRLLAMERDRQRQFKSTGYAVGAIYP